MEILAPPALALVTSCSLDTITPALSHGDDVVLIGFGTFSVKNRAERTAATSDR
ncbi:HU family DNA-binding protein [Nonomuraea sp. KM90]|uniref:HU family DNA-binding protein n=1 Tax=Nonomuraea sp. KM90 TaxID=3457428 RepID=UPI003FCCFD53